MGHPGQSRARTSPLSDPQVDLDADLVFAAQRDRDSFGELYQLYLDPVYRYCLRSLGRREDAQDATSRIFLKAMGALPRFKSDNGHFRTWLFSIAHNELVDTHRSRRSVDELDAASTIADPDSGPEARVVASELNSEVQRLLAVVPPDQRRVLELRYAGLKTAEIALILNCTTGSVRVSQFRALARLRLAMGLAPHREGGSDE